MAEHNTDIVIFGAGIAGLWALARLKAAGYDVLLLEKNAIGGTQTLASQGILHSGLKYTLGGKINKLARQISAMPDIWRAALAGKGPVDLRAAKLAADSQLLLIPKGFTGGVTKFITAKTLGESVREIPPDHWPQDLKNSGFAGSAIAMGEPVIDTASVIRALATPYKDCIRKIESTPPEFLKRHNIHAQAYIFTAADGNHEIAGNLGHDKNLETQKRPLLMGIMKNAPFPLFAHLVGASDKPVATVTTHTDQNGSLLWYFGGQAAERPKDSNPEDTISACQKALDKYLPALDLSKAQWSTLPIDRVEGRSGKGKMPDTPTIHQVENTLYCWPTKLTFAPLLSDMIMDRITDLNITPSARKTDWSMLEDVDFAALHP